MALAQTGEVAARLRAVLPGLTPEIVNFSPRGDRDQISKLDRHGGKGGAFVAEIRDAIRGRKLDAAMHSLKDMPGDEETPGLVIAAMLKREPAADVLVLHGDYAIDEVLRSKAAGLKIGANSVRRAAYLRRLYPDVEIIHYRGAADTRVKKLDEKALQKLIDGSHVGPAGALVMARSGLERIGLADRIAYEFSPEEMLPAVGQGVIAVECARADWETRAMLAKIDDPETRARAAAEREVLWVLNGHCNSPIAGYAQISGGRLNLRAAVISEDGRQIIEASGAGAPDRPRELGRSVGLELLDKGAAKIIEASRL